VTEYFTIPSGPNAEQTTLPLILVRWKYKKRYKSQNIRPV